MNMTNNKAPFGVSISIGIAVKMIKESNVAPSIVLSNLFALQKATTFPKNLDEHFFEHNIHRTNDAEKKVINAILDEMKKPNVDLKSMLTEFFTPIWVKKVPEPVVNNQHPRNSSYKHKSGGSFNQAKPKR